MFGESQTPFVYLLKSELNLEGSIFINAPLAMPVELFNATLLDTEFTWLEVCVASLVYRFEARESEALCPHLQSPRALSFKFESSKLLASRALVCVCVCSRWALTRTRSKPASRRARDSLGATRRSSSHSTSCRSSRYLHEYTHYVALTRASARESDCSLGRASGALTTSSTKLGRRLIAFDCNL